MSLSILFSRSLIQREAVFTFSRNPATRYLCCGVVKLLSLVLLDECKCRDGEDFELNTYLLYADLIATLAEEQILHLSVVDNTVHFVLLTVSWNTVPLLTTEA